MRRGTATLDRSRSFGAVNGGGFAHKYEQDGKCFAGAGSEIIYDGAPSASEEAPAPPVGDPNAIENQPVETIDRKDLANRYAEVTGKKVPRSWNKTKLREAILAHLN